MSWLTSPQVAEHSLRGLRSPLWPRQLSVRRLPSIVQRVNGYQICLLGLPQAGFLDSHLNAINDLPIRHDCGHYSLEESRMPLHIVIALAAPIHLWPAGMMNHGPVQTNHLPSPSA